MSIRRVSRLWGPAQMDRVQTEKSARAVAPRELSTPGSQAHCLMARGQ